MSGAEAEKKTVEAATFDDPAQDGNNSDGAKGADEKNSEITKPGPHDVLLGRGGGTNNHSGNVKFRKLVNEHKMRYLACSKVEKPKVAREVVQLWRKMDPPGRFLARRDETKKGPGSVKDASNRWFEVGDKKAREKASQCLRERTADVLPYIKHLRQQQDQLTEQGVSMVQQQLQQQLQMQQNLGESQLPPGNFDVRRNGDMNGINVMPDRQGFNGMPHRGNMPGGMPPSGTASGQNVYPQNYQQASRRQNNHPGGLPMQELIFQQQQAMENGQYNLDRNATGGASGMYPPNRAQSQMSSRQQHFLQEQQYMMQQQQQQQQQHQQQQYSMDPPNMGMSQGQHVNPQNQPSSIPSNFPGQLSLSPSANKSNMSANMAQQLQLMEQLNQLQQQQQDLEPLPYANTINQNGQMPLPVPDMPGSVPVAPDNLSKDLAEKLLLKQHSDKLLNVKLENEHTSDQPHQKQLHNSQHDGLLPVSLPTATLDQQSAIRHQHLLQQQKRQAAQRQRQQSSQSASTGVNHQSRSMPNNNNLATGNTLGVDDAEYRKTLENYLSNQQQQQQQQRPQPSAAATAGNQGSRPTPNNDNIIDGGIGLQGVDDEEYRKTLEDYITNHQFTAPGLDILDDEVSDPEDLILEGIDTSAFFDNAMKSTDISIGTGKMSTGDFSGKGEEKKRGLVRGNSKKSLMSTGTTGMSTGMSSCMSISFSDMEHSAAMSMRSEKMGMARSMTSNQSLMSELTDFSGGE